MEWAGQWVARKRAAAALRKPVDDLLLAVRHEHRLAGLGLDPPHLLHQLGALVEEREQPIIDVIDGGPKLVEGSR